MNVLHRFMLKFALKPEFFEAKYRKKSDPWGFSSSAYELKRYEAIVRALAGRRYGSAFEPGCSIGVLTERLASFCDVVEAIDFAPSAAVRAAKRCEHLPHVSVQCRSLAECGPLVGVDLLVLSEIGYYFKPEEWQAMSTALIKPMAKGGTVLAAHWLGYSKHHCTTGDEVHEMLLRNPMLQLEHSERSQALRLDRWVKI